MAKSKAAKQRKKAVLVTPTLKTASQPGNNKAVMLNNKKVQVSQKPAQKPIPRTARKIEAELTKTKHKTSYSKQTGPPDPRKTKTRARLAITPRPALPFPSTTKRYSNPYLDDQRLLELRKVICLLFMLTEMPPQPSGNPTPASIADEARVAVRRTLTLAEEERLAGVFAFLASTSHDPRKIAALCLEESADHNELVIKLAANHGDLIRTKLGFEDIARILRAAHEGSLPDLSLCLLETIISMNQNRILCRLQSCHARWQCNFKKTKLARAPILPQVVQLCRQKHAVIPPNSVNQEVDELERCSNALESSEPVDAASVSGVRTLLDVVQIIHRLWLNQDFRALLRPGMLRSSLVKLSRYVSAAYFLVGEARRQSILAMLKVEVVTCEPLPRTTYVPSPEDLQSVSPVSTSQLYRRLYSQSTSPSADTESVVSNCHGGLVNAKCAVHAEIQLLFHYEFHNPHLPPRVICSTKKACYLCNLFFLLHGRFSMPGTHGRLYEKWTLPKCIRDLKGPKAETIHGVVESFFQAIVEAIRHTFILSSKMAFASNESLFLRSSVWPAVADITEEPAQACGVVKTSPPKSDARPQIVSNVEQSPTNINRVTNTPHLICPTAATKQEIPCHIASHPTSDMAVVATKNTLQLYRLDKGASVTLQIGDPTNPAQVKTKSVHFAFSSIADAAAPAKESSEGPRQAYAQVEYLSAEQRLRPHQQSSSMTSVDIATLVPGVDVVVDQYREDRGTKGFYLFHEENEFFVRCWK